MEQFEIYEDINTRTGGDIYLGVVGPVRTGKSTFIHKFMEKLVLPEIKNKNEKSRMVDELPQSAAGKTIMTTEPKFVPNEAVRIMLNNKIDAKFRLIDCVGYLVDGANGAMEEDAPRLVKTPWNAEPIPFEEAAEIGTKKVICEHSTIAVMITTDGTISGIDRANYEVAEEKVVAKLKETGKPFIIVLNTTNPQSNEAKELAEMLSEKYKATVMPIDVLNLDENNIADILQGILYEFPITKINFNLPKWVQALDFDNSLIEKIINELKVVTENCYKMRDLLLISSAFADNDYIASPVLANVSLATGTVSYTIDVSNDIFYKILSEQCGMEIEDEFCLMSCIKDLAYAKKEYDKFAAALDTAKNNGYGIVLPASEELTLEQPQMVKKGGNSGLKLKATAPSYHIMRVDVETEVSPAVGGGEQSDAFNKYLSTEIENNPQAIWNTNMFGRPLSSFVQDGIMTKLSNIPEEAQVKMRKTMTKIVNEGKGGIICILL